MLNVRKKFLILPIAMCTINKNFLPGLNGVVLSKGESFQLSLSDIMVFITGLPTEPPLGFSHKPSIKFCSSSFPRANTCINVLYLPLNVTSDEDFTYSMCFSILNSAGFGQV